MRPIEDKDNPSLVGIIESPEDVTNVKKMIDNLNQDLIDSGFEKYQYEYIRQGDKIFIERT
jgi:hypothetical protein|tara:strand:- start:11285 stop:11467 length:183 start_codon:yes stop_codon:yes gene_type:complete